MFPFYVLSDLAEQLASLPTVKDHSALPEHLEMSSGQASAFPMAGPNPVVAAEPAGVPFSAPHSAPPHIAMFKKMNMLDKISATDCIVLDGGYPLSVLETIVEKSEIYNLSNFCIPIRKPRGSDLSAVEQEYNKRLGSFRSMVENTFRELGNTFKRLSNKDVVRIANPKTYVVEQSAVQKVGHQQALLLPQGWDLPLGRHWPDHWTFPDVQAMPNDP
ncbi:hypothetical protein LPJ55_002592 [Coemansia sp. RSA 990]|nr:hypothetical protein LPJ55_002592 [Coemansia sp. RSA 990]KAJ2669902.1 hypothetical protein IWW42_004356 [Coemansia sp. RSA 1085]